MNEETNDRIIELTDENTGEKVLFEHLDTVELDGNMYFVLTEYYEEEPEESDVYIMCVKTDEDGEESLEIVEDDAIIDSVFDIFKERSGDDYEFLD
ncbi:MAG: hypothetical protein BWY15_01530 [Firmicutes bacterium ADurb.Bin193]|nr:MAG: hypothetical protein BWY15_01530 [Firmicutes bacterium ADurb.Bin193]